VKRQHQEAVRSKATAQHAGQAELGRLLGACRWGNRHKPHVVMRSAVAIKISVIVWPRSTGAPLIVAFGLSLEMASASPAEAILFVLMGRDQSHSGETRSGGGRGK
jgi:hypothetical protein